MLKINGAAADAAGQTLAEYLAGSEFDCRRVAVERNGVIVPKSAYADTVLADGDVIEVVSFVGGG
ncbi:MAG: sulfur carrier protein ThiS [Firmicutes bacterium]|nr:sulfur carrier protein ThiS [Bacillota bacterium]